MQMPDAEDGLAAAIEVLNRAERTVMAVVMASESETCVPKLTGVLQDLSSVRMYLERPDIHGQRSFGRSQQQAVAILEQADGGTLEVSLRDLSAGGALIESDCAVASGSQVLLFVPGVLWGIPGIAKASQNGRVHIAFEKMPPARLLAFLKHLDRALLRY